MVTRRAGVTLIAGLCSLLAGCQSTPTIASLFARRNSVVTSAKPPGQPTASESSFVLDQGMMVYWQAQPAQQQPGDVTSGTGVVGPDGTMEVGPYGTCKVSGLRLDQATTALEQQLAAYMKGPQVRLSMTAAADPLGLAWRPAHAAHQPALVRDAIEPGERIVESNIALEPGVQPVIWRK